MIADHILARQHSLKFADHCILTFLDIQCRIVEVRPDMLVLVPLAEPGTRIYCDTTFIDWPEYCNAAVEVLAKWRNTANA